MRELILGIIFILIGIVALIFLWSLNPLYAFILGVTFIVTLITTMALVSNLRKSKNSASAPPIDPDFQPRRTGEFRTLEEVEKPEFEWESEQVPSPKISREGSTEPIKPLETLEVPIPSTATPPPAPVGNLDDEEEINEPEPTIKGDLAPPAPQASNQPDFANMTPEEINKWLVTRSERNRSATDGDATKKRSQSPSPVMPEPTKEEFDDEDDFITGGLEERDIDPVELLFSLQGTQRMKFMTEVGHLPAEQQTNKRISKIYNEVTGKGTNVGVEVYGADADIQERMTELSEEMMTLSEDKSSEAYEAMRQELEDLYQEHLETTVTETQFTSYYPRQASAETEYGLYVYAHLPDALLESDIEQFKPNLGGKIPKPKSATDRVKLAQGAMLTVMIDCDDLQFNQLGAVQQWQPPFVRFNFAFRADSKLVDEIVEGRIAILLGMIEIASIDFKVLITEENTIAQVTAKPANPRNSGLYEASATATIYQNIFVSYSRKDSNIAEQYRHAQMMAGNTVFMDKYSIRSGENWEDALKGFIDNADIFQLFWSENSAQSDHVRFEWEYALQHRCPDTRCERFIRPAYWQDPLPEIPPELGHLHFMYIDME